MINETITYLRRQKGITQETLATALGVSIQAVSKWETGNSYPDITLIPEIAGYFGVSTDFIFGIEKAAAPETPELTSGLPWDDDGKLRVVQYKGKKLLGRDEYDKDVYINLKYPPESEQSNISTEIWGNCNIDGNVSGQVNCGGSLGADNISGQANAGGSISCDAVYGPANAGGSISCDEVSGKVNAGGSVTCDNVNDGSVNCGGNFSGENITGNVNCGGSIECDEIGGNVESCAGNIKCDEVNGNVKCDGDVYCDEIEGDVNCRDVHKNGQKGQ